MENDYIKVDNHYIIIRNNLSSYSFNEDKDLYHGLDVNIGIASAITAGGRIWMSNFKNQSKFNIYYSDTDSAIIDQPLPGKMVGDKLGQFKLEHEIGRAVFLAPKVYALITTDGKEIIKVKGLTKDAISNVNFRDIENLLVQDAKMTFNQEKWFKNLMLGDITVTDVAYQLAATSNKRKPVYENGYFTHTVPHNYADVEKKWLW